MDIVVFLILFPLLPGLLLLGTPLSIRNGMARIAAVVMACASVYLAFQFLNKGPQFFHLETHLVDRLMLFGEVGLCVFLLWCCRHIKAHEIYAPILVVLQTGVMLYAELNGEVPHVERPLYVDNFSIIMALIVGIIGSLTLVYSIAYMGEYHKVHPEIPNRCRMFFFTFFIFLSSMFGVVFSNSIPWLFFFWEITTLASFLLIGYSQTDQARRSAYRALGMNSLGGLAFSVAILYLMHYSKTPSVELDKVLAMGGSVVMIPAALICFAGMVKSAQMPFSSWLLGAMVAPTPVSALLHASTMVKAGVFVVVKFAPVLVHTAMGNLIALVGGVTFLATSILAVTQHDAKRVLAYSTIANLGLIVMCAGIGTSETVWAAILLIVFHALAKGLLFLTVGPIENRKHSRNIEDMEGLLVNRPILGIFILVGILGMFLAPFGMLIGKYACLKAMADNNIFLAVLLAFGSGPTLFFWAKWMGKVASVPQKREPIEGPMSLDKSLTLGALAVGTFCTGILFPFIANGAVDPYLRGIEAYKNGVAFDWTTAIVMIIMMAVLFVVPIVYLFYPLKAQIAPAYLAGANTEVNGDYRGALGRVHPVAVSNYYLLNVFNVSRITQGTVGATVALLLAMLYLIAR